MVLTFLVVRYFIPFAIPRENLSRSEVEREVEFSVSTFSYDVSITKFPYEISLQKKNMLTHFELMFLQV